MNPREWQWDWIGWQVIAPILGPIAISVIVVLFSELGPKTFPIDWAIVCDDISPWALSFYCVTLICVTLHDFWAKISIHPVLGVSLILLAFLVALYASLIVVWRHDQTFHPGTKLYQIAFVFLLAVTILCHVAVVRVRSQR